MMRCWRQRPIWRKPGPIAARRCRRWAALTRRWKAWTAPCRLQPNLVAALSNRGFALREMGRFDDALESLDRALALPARSCGSPGQSRQGAERNEPAGGKLSSFRAAANQAFGGDKPDGAKLAHEKKHDQEQPIGAAAQGETARITGGERLAGRAVNPLNSQAAAKAWAGSDPKIVVIDNLLTEEALAALRRYMPGSRSGTPPIPKAIWAPFRNPVLPRRCWRRWPKNSAPTFREIFADHPLRYHWAFKYDSSLDGIGIHADEAAVNVNFWITPDAANRDPEAGGLVIWDKAAPLDWDFAKFKPMKAPPMHFLAESGRQDRDDPYRANRAVIFNSNLFHKTDRSLSEGYENRRINITMLYGRRRRA